MFKSFDTFSKRILSVALAVSMVLTAASLFMFSIQKVNAKEPEKKVQTPKFDDNGGYIVQNGNVYWFSNGKLYYIKMSRAIETYNY